MSDQDQPPTQTYDTKLIYDVVTDPKLVGEVVGYRKGLGLTVVGVNAQNAGEANYVTGFAKSGFPTQTSLAVPPNTKCWVVISRV